MRVAGRPWQVNYSSSWNVNYTKQPTVATCDALAYFDRLHVMAELRHHENGNASRLPGLYRRSDRQSRGLERAAPAAERYRREEARRVQRAEGSL